MYLNSENRHAKLHGIAFAFLLITIASCGKAPKRKSPLDTTQAKAATSQVPTPASNANNSAASAMPDDAEEDALRQLNALIRRYNRKQIDFERSEAAYFEKLHLWTLTVVMLEVRHNPGNFAGDIPEHEAFVYSDFMEAAENLISVLPSYIKQYVSKENPDYQTLMDLKEDAVAAVHIKFPGSGSRLQDALDAMNGSGTV